MKKVKFDIKGMTCSSCSSHVEKAVSKLDGIKNVNVNLLSNSMVVEYDEKKLNNHVIIKAVAEAGYGANVKNLEKKHKSTEEQNRETDNIIKSMKKRLIISITFLIPLMYIAMHHMLNQWIGLPIPKIISKLFEGNENAITFGFTQFLLLLPIVYVNRNYFIVGFKRLFKRSPNMDSLIAIGSFAAILYGIYAIYMIGFGLGHGNSELVHKYSMDLYFESAGTILTLITIGKYLETKSKGKTQADRSACSPLESSGRLFRGLGISGSHFRSVCTGGTENRRAFSRRNLHFRSGGKRSFRPGVSGFSARQLQ